MPIKDLGPESAAVIPETVKVERAKKPKALLGKDFQETVYGRGHFTITLPEGAAFEDALQQEYWVNVAHLFKSNPNTNSSDLAGSIIIVDSADRTFCGELYVRAVPDKGLVVGVYRKPVFFGPKGGANPLFDTRWNIGDRGWDIIRKSDNEIVGPAKKFPIKEDAVDWINATISAMRVQ